MLKQFTCCHVNFMQPSFIWWFLYFGNHARKPQDASGIAVSWNISDFGQSKLMRP
jgi:hypothetical protein